MLSGIIKSDLIATSTKHFRHNLDNNFVFTRKLAQPVD